MPFSIFTDTTTPARAGRIYQTVALAQQDADARNAKAVLLGISTHYSIRPYTPEGNEKVRDSYQPIP